MRDFHAFCVKMTQRWSQSQDSDFVILSSFVIWHSLFGVRYLAFGASPELGAWCLEVPLSACLYRRSTPRSAGADDQWSFSEPVFESLTRAWSCNRCLGHACFRNELAGLQTHC